MNFCVCASRLSYIHFVHHKWPKALEISKKCVSGAALSDGFVDCFSRVFFGLCSINSMVLPVGLDVPGVAGLAQPAVLGELRGEMWAPSVSMPSCLKACAFQKGVFF